MFGPAGRAFEATTLIAAAAVVALTVVVWNRVRGRAWLKVVQRVLLVVLCQAVAVAATFAVVNHANSFYLTWPELAGAANVGAVTIQDEPTASHGATATAVPSEPGASGLAGLTPSPATSTRSAPTPTQTPTTSTGPTPAARSTVFSPDGSGLYQATVVGQASGVEGQVLVWTPPGYSPSGPALPVLLTLAGYPGNPVDTYNGLRLRTALPDLISSGQLPPMIVVSASTNIGGKDWGCSNAPGGPQVATWLTQDVPAVVTSQFHVRTPGRWGVLGVSAGAACAVRLAITHPGTFAAATSIAGYNAPDSPVLSGDPAAVAANNLATLASAGTAQPVALLLAASRQDPGSLVDARALQHAVGPGLSADLETVAHGGHNWDVWAAMTPPALVWMGQHLDH